jgi:hypothetical protein
MFNLPTNIRLPGLPDDPPGQNTETAPDFAVPALGYDPDGNAIQTAQATGLGFASFDPQGLVPVNCTSAWYLASNTNRHRQMLSGNCGNSRRCQNLS